MTVTKFRTTSVCVVVLDYGHIGYCENTLFQSKSCTLLLSIGQTNWIMISRYFDDTQGKGKGLMGRERVKEYTD